MTQRSLQVGNIVQPIARVDVTRVATYKILAMQIPFFIQRG